MKYLFTSLFIFLAVSACPAQTKVQASEIIRLIEEGRPVEFNNVTIEGELDLTDLKTRYREHSPATWFDFDNDLYEASVNVSLKFTNCTFLDDVLAYYHIDRKDETYIAHFEKDVIFKNCTFNHASEFKYSRFNGDAIFTGSKFREPANFKYARFSNGPLFAAVQFDSGADFKYVKFPGETSFEKATFHGLANFKYTKFREPLNIKSVSFEGSEDFKYTKIDGRSFTSYLLARDR